LLSERALLQKKKGEEKIVSYAPAEGKGGRGKRKKGGFARSAAKLMLYIHLGKPKGGGGGVLSAWRKKNKKTGEGKQHHLGRRGSEGHVPLCGKKSLSRSRRKVRERKKSFSPGIRVKEGMGGTCSSKKKGGRGGEFGEKVRTFINLTFLSRKDMRGREALFI